MEKIKINLRGLGATNSFFKIPIGQAFIPTDTSEIAENQFVNDEVTNAINKIQDYEKIRFKPFSGVTEVIINLMDAGTTNMTYDSVGMTNDDLKFQKNRFKNSFVKLDFFDSPNPTNRRLAFQLILYNQINRDQLDSNNLLLDVSVSPITYRLVDPITVRDGISEGFYLYWLKTPKESYPTNFYMYATYNNAKDGIVSQLVAYDAPVPINIYNNINYVPYQLVSVGNIQEYSADDTNRTVEYSNNQMIINLYNANLI